MLDVFNSVFRTGQNPASWKLTLLFTMMPKKLHSTQTSDFRPIANIRLFYKVFAYMLLPRIENILELEQPTLFEDFYAFCLMWMYIMQFFLFTACAQNGLALWRAGIDHWPFRPEEKKFESEVRMPKRQPTSGREPGQKVDRNNLWDEFDYCVQNLMKLSASI